MTTPAGRRTQVLLITGPAGVGKSTLSWEISARLAASGVAHAAIEGDESTASSRRRPTMSWGRSGRGRGT